MEPEEPKKSETIEVRVPWRLKQDFMARARREGRSASEVIRDLMTDYVRRPAQRTPQHTLETAMNVIRKRPRAGFAAIICAAGLSALITSTLPAGAAVDLRAQFERLDANGNGVVSRDEMIPANGGDQQTFRLEGAVGATGVQSFQLQRSIEEASVQVEIERIGPILLPVTEHGQTRVLMIWQTRARDGELQTIEMTPPAPLLAEFQSGDADGDGALSFAEFAERYDSMRARSFTTLDANGDGVIADAEMTSNPLDGLDGPDGEGIAEALRSVDGDSDGRVTREEYNAAL